MSTAYQFVPESEVEPTPMVRPYPPRRPLHRLKAVRRQEQISRATLARRLKTSVREVELQEEDSADMLLTTLYKWQEALDVPLCELLVETEEPLSTPVLRRAQLLRIMKTVATILERSRQVSIQRMAQTLADQLTELMPELKDATPWPAVGRRRSRRELGLAARRCLSAKSLGHLDESE